MISLINILLFSITFFTVKSFRNNNKFITFNSSASQHVISTSIATNLNEQFTLYSPVLVKTKEYKTIFRPSESNNKLTVQPRFIEDQEILYNDFYQGEYWYGFKKQLTNTQDKIRTNFALAKINTQEIQLTYVMPLFSLPLTFLRVSSLYKCDNVLISFIQTDKLIDITVFSTQSSWHLYPQATWGFRNKDGQINFSRQTYPLGSRVQIQIKGQKKCVLSSQLKSNENKLEDKDLYNLQELRDGYSTALQVEQVKKNTPVQEQL